jgi:hypothetical protein
MTKSLLLSVLLSSGVTLALVPALAACGGESEDDIGTGEEDYTAGRGQLCGGFAGTRCNAGLRCNYNRGVNTGTCVDDPNATTRGAGEGETCGGTANVQCKSGLTCKKRSGTTKGTCVTATATCQALPECDEGHQKVANADACTQEDAPCYKRALCGKTIWCYGPTSNDDDDSAGAGAGEMCGGFAGTQCKAGLRCDNSLGLNTGRCR